jgi:MFS family permease
MLRSMSFTSGATQPIDRWRDVYLAGVTRAVSTCGDFLAATALVLTLQQRGSGGWAVAAVLLAVAVPPAVLAPLTGRLADRVDSRLLLVCTGIAQAGICLALAYATSTVAIVALVAALGAGLAITQPTLLALVPAMVGRDSVPRASAIGQTATSVGMLVAPALGGLLVGEFGLRVPLLVDAASYLVLAAGALLLRTRRSGGGRAATSLGAASRQAAGPGASRQAAAIPGAAADPGAARPAWSLWREPLLRPLVLVTAAVAASLTAINVVDVFFVRETLHSSATVYGLLDAVWTGAMLAGGWLATLRKPGDATLALATLGVNVVISLVVLAWAGVPAVGWLVPLRVLGGVSNGVLNVTTTVLFARRVPAELRGRAFAVLGGAMQGAVAVGYLLGGALLGVLAIRPLLAACGVAGLVAAAAFTAPLLRGVARERRTSLGASSEPGPSGVPEPTRTQPQRVAVGP